MLTVQSLIERSEVVSARSTSMAAAFSGNLREELLACCKDNQETLNNIGVTLEQVQNDDYSGTDYEFFLTTDRKNEGKYHYSAFYKSLDEQNECIQHINNWNVYLEDKTKRATKKN